MISASNMVEHWDILRRLRLQTWWKSQEFKQHGNFSEWRMKFYRDWTGNKYANWPHTGFIWTYILTNQIGDFSQRASGINSGDGGTRSHMTNLEVSEKPDSLGISLQLQTLGMSHHWYNHKSNKWIHATESIWNPWPKVNRKHRFKSNRFVSRTSIPWEKRPRYIARNTIPT